MKELNTVACPETLSSIPPTIPKGVEDKPLFQEKETNVIFEYFKDISDDCEKYKYAYFVELYLKNGFNEIDAYKEAFKTELDQYDVELSNSEISQYAKIVLSHSNTKHFLSFLTNQLFNNDNLSKNLINSKIYELLNAKTKKVFFSKEKVVEKEVPDYKTQRETLIALMRIENESKKIGNEQTGGRSKYVINFTIPRPGKPETEEKPTPTKQIIADYKEVELGEQVFNKIDEVLHDEYRRN